MLRKITEYFIPAKKKESGDELRSERIFIAVLLISSISNFLGINLAVEIDAKLNGQLLFVNGIINLIILFAYRQGLAKNIAAGLFLTQFAISFPLQAWLQGGLSSPATAAFFLLPSVAMLIQGKRASIFWVIVSAFLMLGILILENTIGVPEPQYNTEKEQVFFFSSILGTNITIFLILLVYELGKSKALKNIQEKNVALINTQEQLIQAEKMASLGELTAGIAHEIQNPLNFVNNFSEVSEELLEEIQEEISKGNFEEVKAITDDLKQNLSKINHHGKRAGAIVKGMLEHSRKSDGIREPININELAEECIRLSFHGFKAKEKYSKVEYTIDFEKGLPHIEVIPQDINRVLINVFNNAFYAVHDRSKTTEDLFRPHVKVATKSTSNGIMISVHDNGVGIPEHIKDKIFQPFFTTKPTGQGTGLGLSLSYDIIKAHGGKIEIKSDPNQGTEFVIYFFH
ncbi:sensor histidine kinase [Algoriphagus zhangzhouensis]|uniref:histidine kinase n=1 Tax=Algoriphagus zhangzhouensis TaxID=1073327 RepID=A0A1M7Z9Q3_9BACT|nr:ATP-binding protein [Algoriphagus zhangzhouensis]TDY47318.1 phospho-acceptor domain-containing protein [Algoriphagus zhangzhouensis]SHO61663.1 His Kinase A (phospho-acceptor) domain-containing protein [Algoriphagus zhangzhouensis]